MTYCQSLIHIFKIIWVRCIRLTLSHSSYGMSRLAPLMNVLLWGRRDFIYKLLDQGYVRERSISSLRKIYGRYGVLFKHYEVSLTTFWDKSVYSDMFHWTDISLVVTLLLNWSLLPTLTLLPDAGSFIRTFTTGAASQQLIRTPGPLWDLHLF